MGKRNSKLRPDDVEDLKSKTYCMTYFFLLLLAVYL